MHGFDDVFLKDTTTRRIVLADSTGPLVIVRSASINGSAQRHRRRHRLRHRRHRWVDLQRGRGLPNQALRPQARTQRPMSLTAS